MEYNGFISDLIKRSEELLFSEPHDEFSVTRLLLIMNTGFSLVSERIRFWDEANTRKLMDPNPWETLEKVCASKLKETIVIDERQFFENFRCCDDWAYWRFKTGNTNRKFTSMNILKNLDSIKPRPISQLTLSSVVKPLRNSFAHGGILPMSPNQVDALLPEKNTVRLRKGNDQHQIDRVYFVSKWTGKSINDHIGFIVLEFGLAALKAFWDDWRSLLLVSDPRALSQLDRAA